MYPLLSKEKVAVILEARTLGEMLIHGDRIVLQNSSDADDTLTQKNRMERCEKP